MSCSTSPQVVPTGSYRIVIEGLAKSQDADQIDQKEALDEESDSLPFSIIMHEEELVSELWNRIEEHGFQKPVKLIIDNVDYHEDTPKYVVSNHDEVRVVADDQISTKNTVRLTESLISHANTHHGKPIDFNITPLLSSERAVEANCGFHVSFERTPRMPDDNRLHQLPGSLGSYDMFSVEAYSSRLPVNINESGGVFFPMWQREAMWLNFEPKQHKCAVRVFMGHVNVISGRTMEETANKEVKDQQQDYIVIPGQQWLDGICVAPGVVRQFVAMPLGSGYTVEGQKTSKEQHGGLQLEITPEFLPKQRLWSYSKDDYIMTTGCDDSDGIDERKTPAQLGCKIGDVLRSYPVDSTYEEPFRMKHLARLGADITCTAIAQPSRATAVLDSLLYRLKSSAPASVGWAPQPQHIDYAYGSGAAQTTMENTTNCAMLPTSNTQPDFGPENSCTYERSYASEVSVLRESVLLNLCSPVSDQVKCLDDNLVESLELKDHGKSKVVDSKDIKAMGLAAGGKLIQDIYKDPYPALIWNHAAARILHVHILDPVSCEKVTHIVPRPPPIDAKAYTEAGGEFFVVEEKVDERLDGGDFDNVKSVSQMDQHVGVSTEPEFDPTKPKMCTTCELRLCDCIIRPCDHQFCNVCIKRIEHYSDENPASAHKKWKCPTCDSIVSHVAGFSAPMNLPGEEPLRIKVPVNVLKIEDGRVRFESVQKTRI